MIAACICIILSQYHSRRPINDYQKRHLRGTSPDLNQTALCVVMHITFGTPDPVVLPNGSMSAVDIVLTVRSWPVASTPRS
jgi:hypothetical protein